VKPKKLALFIIILVILAGVSFSYFKAQVRNNVNSFEECVEAGNPILESYPSQCITPDGKKFTQDIGNELEKINIIRVNTPRPNEKVTSPLEIKGEARGAWFFEGSFPLEIVTESGVTITQSFVTAEGDWMTEEFIPFSAEVAFDPGNEKSGFLILKKDNPSGLIENDDFLKIPLKF
jgi:hypothetical protein